MLRALLHWGARPHHLRASEGALRSSRGTAAGNRASGLPTRPPCGSRRKSGDRTGDFPCDGERERSIGDRVRARRQLYCEAGVGGEREREARSRCAAAWHKSAGDVPRYCPATGASGAGDRSGGERSLLPLRGRAGTSDRSVRPSNGRSPGHPISGSGRVDGGSLAPRVPKVGSGSRGGLGSRARGADWDRYSDG